MSIQQFLASIQQRPYEQRLRLFWIMIIVVAIPLAIGWWALGRLTPSPQPDPSAKTLEALGEHLGTAAEKFGAPLAGPEKPTLPGLSEGYRAIAVTKTVAHAEKQELIITLTIKNPTPDILVFLNPTRSNINLYDGEQRLAPLRINGKNSQPLMPKILSGATYEAEIVFPLPRSTAPKVNVQDLYFETQPSRLFGETIELTLLTDQVKGIQNLRLPRQ